MKHAIDSSPFITLEKGEPLAALAAWSRQARVDELLLVEFSLPCWWLEGGELLALTAVYFRDQAGRLHCAVTDRALSSSAGVAGAQFNDWVRQHALAVFSPGQSLRLLPEHIPKPWGQEIWFTGVEARGVCRFTDGSGSVPIPWLQAIMPDAAAGAPGAPLVLLKILDPSPEEVVGDLYFELHEEKREVYVVTHVDERAWPEGIGGIRYGFDREKISQAGDEATFRRQYLAAVEQYEAVRRQIDATPQGVPAEAGLLQRERELRQAMNDFTSIRPLQVGDVVVVPLRMPHSLQHGVRTIEFQTPVYERQILSFAQKVLTQDHWDTAAAVDTMRLTPPEQVDFERLPGDDSVLIERIVDFPDFEVRRLRIGEGASQVYSSNECYALVMVVEGQLALDQGQLGPEQAALLPAGVVFHLASAEPAEPLVLLLARPHR